MRCDELLLLPCVLLSCVLLSCRTEEPSCSSTLSSFLNCISSKWLFISCSSSGSMCSDPQESAEEDGEIFDFSLELSGSNETVEALKNGKALESTFSNP
jgi:hypothetical protein